MKVLRVLSLTFGALLLLAVCFVIWLNHLFAPSRDEVVALRSPDGRFTARLIEVNGGATVAFAYQIFLAPTEPLGGGTEVAKLYAPASNGTEYGVNLRWVSRTELHVEYLDARIVELVAPTVDIQDVTLTTILKPGTRHSRASQGGDSDNPGGHK